jgi:2,4-dienoyl-CoA reductase [(3E)-enoyl-CoA-producing], peroxisomal
MFAGKVLFATGASTKDGINIAIVRSYVAEGGRVFLVGRRQQLLDDRCVELGGATRARAAVADVRNETQLQAAVQQCVAAFGRIDALLCGAAGNFLCSSEDLSTNALRTVIEIDTIGTFVAIQACRAELARTKGCILSISATLHYTQTPLQLHASVAKAGLDALTRNLAVEFGKLYGVRVNGIAPGAIAGTEGMSRLSGGQDASAITDIIPMRRMGVPADIAKCAIFLLSDAASYITGQNIVVDGGAQLHTPELVPAEVYAMIRKPQRGRAKL